MHKIIFKNKEVEYISSDQVDEYFEKMKKKEIIKIGNNIRDTMDIKSVKEMTESEEMIYNLLKNENEYVNKKVKEEVDMYFKELTPGVMKNIIAKYKG